MEIHINIRIVIISVIRISGIILRIGAGGQAGAESNNCAARQKLDESPPEH
jgi:hypothetical protein